MPRFYVDEAKCKKDGICSRLCPIHILKPDASGIPRVIEQRASLCIGCGHCVAFCPHDASALEGLPMSSVTPLDKNAIPDATSIFRFIQSRRSTRSFKKRAVELDVLREVLAVCALAPTASNRRSLRWVMLHSPEKLRELNALVVTAFADRAKELPEREARGYAMLANGWRNDPTLLYRTAPHLLACIAGDGAFAARDAAIALTYFEVTAHARDIGCCWGGYITTAAMMSQAVRDFFGMKEGEMFGGAQMFGYTLLHPHRTPPREPFGLEIME